MNQKEQISQDAPAEISNLVEGLSSVFFDNVSDLFKNTVLTKPDNQSLSNFEQESISELTKTALSTSVNVSLPEVNRSLEYYEDLIPIPTNVPSVKEKEVELTTTLDGFKEDELRPHSLLISDRNKALKMMDELLAEFQTFEAELDAQIKKTDACPYQQSLNEFLGPNFICPTIDDLPLPENYDANACVQAIFEINERHHNLFLAQMEVMAREAADTSFPGVTSQNLNNAFAPLSTTANGQEFVFDREKYAKHLEFVEIIRNLNSEDIIVRPYEIIQKLVTRYIEIHK